MNTPWISRAITLSILTAASMLAGCGEVPRYGALDRGDPPGAADPGATDPGDEGPSAGRDIVLDRGPSAHDHRPDAPPANPGDPTDPADPTDPSDPTGGPVTCVVIAPNTNGAVRDTFIVEDSDEDRGALGYAWTSSASSTHAQMLLRFELSIPAAAEVVSAVATLHHIGNDVDTVNVHRVTARWSDDVTFTSFGGAYSTEIEASFINAEGPRSFDLTALARGWADGSIENDGILLEQDAGGATQFRTSEWNDASDRPTLEVCTTLPLTDDPSR